jgi:PAS domain S-box-containing protein
MNVNLFETLTNGQPIHVLLVDDDEDSYMLTRRHLSKITGQKLHLDWSPSYEEGLDLISENRHHVYLLDYRLGVKTGIELLKEALALGCKAPIIMLTTENPEVDAEAMKLGAADFLSKDKLDSSLLERSIRYSLKHFRTLQVLREREAQMDAFMQNVPCAVYMKDLEGRYIYANETCATVFRRGVGEVVGKTDADLLPKTTATKSRNIHHQVISQNRAIETTESFTREDGAHYWLTTRFPICNHHGEVMMVGGAAIDITENKRLEREVQEISEREKRRIGQDLHDGLGQYLTGIACMVKVVEQKLEMKYLPESADVGKITAMVNETISQARDLARGLCPVELENNGLQAALQELASRVSRTNVVCSFKAPTFAKVYDNAAAIHLYRIAQEAVNNSIKHGNAKSISIGLNTQNNQVELTVQDDGRGIHKTGGKPNGMGLRVMNYRAAMIGATVTVEPAPGSGTLVRCVMPNRPPDAKKKSVAKKSAARAPGTEPRTSHPEAAAA